MSHLNVVQPIKSKPLELWVETVSGRRIDFLSPNPKLIDLGDIAWALSRIPLFSGHTGDPFPLTIAMHSVWVAMYMYKRTDCHSMGLYGLLHDANKAYMGDIHSGLRQLPSMRNEFDQIEARLQAAIYKALDLLPPSAAVLELIEEAQEQALLQEARMHMRSAGSRWKHLAQETLAAACVGPAETMLPEAGRRQYLLVHKVFTAKLIHLH